MKMPGASGNTAIQHMYTLPKEATAFAAIQPGAITKPIYDQRKRIQYDFTQLVYLGSANTEVNLCWVRNDAPVKSFKDLFSKELIIGAGGEGDSTRDFRGGGEQYPGDQVPRHPALSGRARHRARDRPERGAGPLRHRRSGDDGAAAGVGRRHWPGQDAGAAERQGQRAAQHDGRPAHRRFRQDTGRPPGAGTRSTPSSSSGARS